MTGQGTNPARRVPFPLYDDDDDAEPASPRRPWTSTPTALPSDHFLAQRPVSPDLARHTAGPDTSSLAAADFDVSVETGFLPPQEPIQSVAHLAGGWAEMEHCLADLATAVDRVPGGGVGKLGDALRRAVEQLPAVDCARLATLPLLRRAHTLVAHLAHYYMHSSFPSQTVVPAALAVPLVYTSDKLGIPPVLTYADTVLWVWKLVDPAKPLRADNVDITTNFTRSPSERAFFLLSLLCELKGPAILRLMSSTLDETFFADRVARARIGTYLDSIATLIDELTTLMRDAVRGEFGPPGNRHSIVPSVFYWEIRPWFNGGKWVYERAGPDGRDVEMEWGGPSAGQSSLVHAIDLFLGVDHSPRPSPKTTTTTTTTTARGGGLSDSTFMQRMSTYMPHHHRSFLRHLVSIHSPSSSSSSAPALPSVRALAQTYPAEVGPSYDRAVSAMKRFRDAHIILATHFIVAQARHAPAADSVHYAEWETKRVAAELARRERERDRTTTTTAAAAAAVVVGTGGTDLSSFLKLCRDRTKEALLVPPTPR
ncbi:hypothetical protein JCM11491_000690 [Sporobolomyces phaffii]